MQILVEPSTEESIIIRSFEDEHSHFYPVIDKEFKDLAKDLIALFIVLIEGVKKANKLAKFTKYFIWKITFMVRTR